MSSVSPMERMAGRRFSPRRRAAVVLELETDDHIGHCWGVSVLLDWVLIGMAGWAVGWPLVLLMVAGGIVVDLLLRLLRSPLARKPVDPDALRDDPVF